MDNKCRCSWCTLKNPLYVEYHDKEWGVPNFDDKYLYVMLILESFQAGLSWECVLNKRESFRAAYDNFDIDKVAEYDEAKIIELLSNQNIIRNRLKIKASIKNSRIFKEIVGEYGSFYNYLRTFTKDRTIYETGKTTNDVSDAISKDLQKRGMTFVGSVIIYSYLQAIGVIYSHDKDCYLYKEVLMNTFSFSKTVEKWGMFEFRAAGKTDGNPFADYDITAEFEGANEKKTVTGFYDGNGEYVVRFMPEYEGTYSFKVSGSFSEETYSGDFFVTEPSEGNHGPLRIVDKYHFRYADGTPYYSLGTTCYAWVHQPEEMQVQTLETLKNSAFNKIRFCIFPKHYDYNYEDPVTFPYEGIPCDNSKLNRSTMFAYMEDKSSNQWDFKRFNTEHFRQFDKRIAELQELGIEADLILFHPYDRWGFDGMGAENDDFFVKYMVARYGAFRNVWWSLANEYDYVKTKIMEDWDRIGELIHAIDPFHRFCSVHNGPKFYDFSREWITHCSCQGTDRYRAVEFTDDIRKQYGKPVVWDEILYEGNIDLGWGNISGEELTRRFWEATMRGGYVGHGETYLFATDDSVDHAKLWWSHGGVLHGDSPERIRFLAQILKDIPGGKGLQFMPQYWDAVAATTDPEQKDFIIFYFSFLRPLYRDLYFDDETEYEVDVIDTWNMEIKPQGVFKGNFRIVVGGKPYMALRVKKQNK